MKSNDKIKEININNHTCYYFDHIIKIEVFDVNIFLDQKSHGNILIYDVSHKILISSKPMRIRFAKVAGFIRVYEGTRYLGLF